MRKSYILFLLLSLLIARTAFSQRIHGRSAPVKLDSAWFDGGMADMSSAILPDLSMERDGSGTSWLPDNSPLQAAHYGLGEWDLMLHGSAYFSYNSQNFNNDNWRGGNELSGPNWVMGMARRELGESKQMAFRLMMSLDRLTEGGDGYPLLYQSGETWQGKRLVDKQHPHDLFSEVAVMYGHALSENVGAFAYFGYPGEPALGPPAYMHRHSSDNNPSAPLGHHWQDATHIIFGVATAGMRYRQFKLDGSIFTGREPNENRYNFDKPRFDSYGGRLSYNPWRSTAFQVSYGFLNEPEAIEPGTNINRLTFSALYARRSGENRNWSSAFIWGMNKPTGHVEQHSFLLESAYDFSGNAIYGRFEMVGKSGEELEIENANGDIFQVAALTLGAAGQIVEWSGVSLSVGGQVTAFREVLEEYYGERPLSYQLYLHFSPAVMRRGHNLILMPGMDMEFHE